MTKTANKYPAEICKRSIRGVLKCQGQHDNSWSAILVMSAKIVCAPQTLNERVKNVEVETENALFGPVDQK